MVAVWGRHTPAAGKQDARLPAVRWYLDKMYMNVNDEMRYLRRASTTKARSSRVQSSSNGTGRRAEVHEEGADAPRRT